MPKNTKLQPWPRLAAGALALAVGLSACAARVDVRGNLPDPELLAEIEAGGFGRDDVVQLIGSPSTVAMFENETWIYVSQKTETVAFFAPEVVEQEVVVLQFGGQGGVASVTRLDIEDGKVVTPTQEITPTLGNDLTMLEQLLGNFGRFNPKE